MGLFDFNLGGKVPTPGAIVSQPGASSPISLADARKQLHQMQLQHLQMMQQGPLAPMYSNVAFHDHALASPAPLPEEEVLCATGGIVGWRSWKVKNFGDLLYSFNGAEWKPRSAFTAKCDSPDCAGPYCDCGTYAWKSRDSLRVNRSPAQVLDGECWLWGRVIEHELGYRAEFAYPKAFVDSGALARRMARLFGVKMVGEKAE